MWVVTRGAPWTVWDPLLRSMSYTRNTFEYIEYISYLSTFGRFQNTR